LLLKLFWTSVILSLTSGHFREKKQNLQNKVTCKKHSCSTRNKDFETVKKDYLFISFHIQFTSFTMLNQCYKYHLYLPFLENLFLSKVSKYQNIDSKKKIKYNGSCWQVVVIQRFVSWKFKTGPYINGCSFEVVVITGLTILLKIM